MARHDTLNTWRRQLANHFWGAAGASLAWTGSHLASLALMRFELTGDVSALQAGIVDLQRVIALTRDDHPRLARCQSDLGSALLKRYHLIGDPTDLDAAIDAGQRALAATPPDDPNLNVVLSQHGSALLRRFEFTGDPTDLDAAFDAGQRALAATPPDDPNLNVVLSQHGSALLRRFEFTGDPNDLDAAIDAGQRALAATPPAHPGLAAVVSNLGNSQRIRFEFTGDGADLDAAIDAGQRALAVTPPDDPDIAGTLSNLGATMGRRFEFTGDSADLDAAIDIGRRAIQAAPPGHPGRGIVLTSWGVSLWMRFEFTGDDADLDAAIDAGHQALAATPPGHPYLPVVCSNLGSALGRRFERTGDGADLDAAIDAGHQALAATPPGHSYLPLILSNLVGWLRKRFERTGDDADLDAAIDAGRQAVRATPPAHIGLAGILSSVGAACNTRFELTGDGADLDAAIDAGRQAVQAAPPGHSHLGLFLSNLGAFLRARFELTGHGADLDAAIDAGRQAVQAAPPGYPGLADYLSNLGDTLRTRYDRSGDRAHLDAAINCWQRASQVATGTPRTRLTAAVRWSSAAADMGQTGAAVEGYTMAVGLLHEVAWHGLNRATREDQLVPWAGLVGDAAASAVLNDRPERAVELLEQGRSMLWAQALNLRTDLTDLTEKAPALAQRLNDIRAVLDTPTPGTALPISEPPGGSQSAQRRARQQQDALDLRRRMAREWDEALREIRSLDGFAHFMTATPYAELAAATPRGPVVVVNASSYGSHALIVDAASDRPCVVDLPGVSRDAAADQAIKMLMALAGSDESGRTFLDRERDRHALLDVLGWIWDVIAEPVLTALGHTSSPRGDDSWPRVWWCPTGPLLVLPIHAAGHYSRHRTATPGTADSVLDRVVSSYTPTLTALRRARQTVPPARVRHLGVGMPTTPGLEPLPSVRAELSILAHHFPPGQCHQQLAESQATRDAVLAAVADHSWIHMACHARQEQADPDRSGFALWDGTLMINDLAALPTREQDLAFLSACQTATGSFHHLDEAIHLGAAMQFLGYRHVIATMWTIADSPAPNLVSSLYTALTEGATPDLSQTAHALHQAVQLLRREDPTDPLLWAPYIHLGI